MDAPAKRIHIEHPLKYGGKKATFIVDLYHPGTDPGYSAVLATSQPVAVVVVTRVVEEEVTHVWVQEDKDGLTNQAKLTAEQVVNSRIFVGDILEVMIPFPLFSVTPPSFAVFFCPGLDGKAGIIRANLALRQPMVCQKR